MCPLRPPLFWRFQGQVVWSDCMREGKIRRASRGLTPSSVSVFHCQHLRSSVLRPASGRALRFVSERRMSELGEKMAIRDNLIYRWETLPSLPSVPRESLNLSLPPSLISFSPLSIYITPSFSLISLQPSLFLWSSLALPLSPRSLSVLRASIHHWQHREDRLMPAQSSESRSDQLSCSQSMPYLSEIPPSIPHSPSLSQHVPPSLVYEHDLSTHAPTE